MPPEFGETWVYESLVGTVPGLHFSPKKAIAVQILVFETAVLVVAAVYGLWNAVPAGTAGVAVAGIGSWIMLVFSRRIRTLETPERYRRLLFGSSVEVALSVLAFVLFITYVTVVDPRGSGTPLLDGLFGADPPAVAVALFFLICWDVVYRIGTCWWATVVGFWRALRYRFDHETTRKLTRIDSFNMLFAGVQLSLVPFVLSHPTLVIALLGHVVAVFVIAAASIILQRGSVTDSRP